MKRYFNRRDFLRMSGLAGAAGSSFLLNPFQSLTHALVDGMIARAEAQVTGLNARRYLHIGLPGGPPRWTFDLALSPYEAVDGNDTDHFFQNPAGLTGTNYRNGLFQYQTVPVGGFHLPALWGSNLPNAAGAKVSDLFRNAILMRGFEMATDGHGVNFLRQLQPLSSKAGLHGMVADNSNNPLAAVVSGQNDGLVNAYRSDKGRSMTSVFPTNINETPRDVLAISVQNEIFGAFKTTDTRKAKIINDFQNTQFTTALNALENFSRSKSVGSSSIYQEQRQAKDLINWNLAQFSTFYQERVERYRSLCHDCRNMNDLFTEPIVRPANSASRGSDQNPNATNTDLRTLVNNNISFVPRLAENMALVEYLFLNDLTSSFAFGVYGVMAAMSNDLSVLRRVHHDHHGTGTGLSMVVLSYMYKCIASCIYELRDRLGPKWDETVVHIGSEFSRQPYWPGTTRTEALQDSGGTGSNHAPQSNCLSIFSGAIKQGMVIGSIHMKDTNAEISAAGVGTYGCTVVTDNIDGGVKLGVGHSTSTVARVLRVPAIMPNFSSLVYEQGGEIKPVASLRDVLTKNKAV